MVEKETKNANTSSVWTRFGAMCASAILVAIVFTLVAVLSTTAVPKPPNIIFILADDLGWNDVSVHGSNQISTPNIDALAASGILLNNYYAHPQCTPSRGALMSGKYANRLGLQHEDLRPAEVSGLPLNIVTLPDFLRKRGYSTHLIGKWHLGYHKKSYLPTRRGFDTFFGYLNDNIDYYDYTCYYQDASAETMKEVFGIDLWENEKLIRNFRGEYATNVFTNRAVRIIEEHNSTKPLFVMLSHAAPHVGNAFFPLQCPGDVYERNNHIADVDRRTYAGMISSLDDSVGDLFKILNKKNMLQNSIIVVSSDNGAPADSTPGSNWPLRGSKYSLFEGAVRIVGLIWSPLLQLEMPRVSTALMHITDWLPTFYFAAGGDVADLGDIDGTNMWPSLLNADINSPRQEILLHVDSFTSSMAIRVGDMKLLLSNASKNGSNWFGPSGIVESAQLDNTSSIKNILLQTNRWLLDNNSTNNWKQDASVTCGENFLPVSGKCDFSAGPCLYNITDDPCEFKNLANLFPKIVEDLMKRLQKLNATSLPVQLQKLDPLGNPNCHNFAHTPWKDDTNSCQTQKIRKTSYKES